MNTSENNTDLIVLSAVKVAPDERAAYLDKVCGSDTVLRQQVEGLLLSHFERIGAPNCLTWNRSSIVGRQKRPRKKMRKIPSRSHSE